MIISAIHTRASLLTRAALRNSHSRFAIHTRTHFVARERAALIIWGAARATYNKAAPTMPI